ncbi:recombinase family protein [Paraburkholderia megapolitana]|uniref:recombinase family protein n=1 Tax=Paraburkholderia megapolitana TaxID=420953 RepID=UPI0038BDF592
MLIGYARVSTRDQDTRAQIDALQKAGCEEIHDEKRSAATRRRPVFHGIMATIGPGDTLVVYKLDRIARSLRDLLNILDELTAAGADFKSLSETIETRSPAGRMMLQMLGAFAEFEREIIRERTRAGIHAAIRRGAKVGRPKSLTREQEQELVTLWRSNAFTKAALARRYGTHPRTVDRVILRLEIQLRLPLSA